MTRPHTGATGTHAAQSDTPSERNWRLKAYNYTPRKDLQRKQMTQLAPARPGGGVQEGVGGTVAPDAPDNDAPKPPSRPEPWEQGARARR